MGPTSYRVGTATSTPYARTVAGSETRQTVLQPTWRRNCTCEVHFLLQVG